MDAENTRATVNSEQPVIQLPAPTAFPFAMALGTALVCTGLLTDVSVSVLGAILTIFGAVGWFREVLPHEHHEAVPVLPQTEAAEVIARPEVMRLEVAQEVPRAWLPLKVYPISAGVKGGLAGGVAMALLAVLYGVIFYHSIWYPINLLAGTLYSSATTPGPDAMMHFRLGWFLFAVAMHLTMCVLVGILYGAMLPLLPTRPIVLGGVIAPLLWTGLLYYLLDFVNPLLDQRIDWWWFAASQVAFGIVAGLVVAQQNKVWTTENLPFAVRAGLEVPGLMHERETEDDRP